MEDCNICYSKISDLSEQKTLSCQHSLCNNCYLHLTKSLCPYCRSSFEYSLDDIIKRQELNIDTHNVPPLQLSDTTINLLEDSFNQLDISDNIINNNIHFSRYNRQKIRRRRKNLTDDEIKEKRRIIRNKCKRKWLLKEGRLNKLKWYEVIL